MRNKKKTQKAKKRKQDEEQSHGKTFLSGARMSVHLKRTHVKTIILSSK